ncbi:MAG: hypothetical protein B6229_07785 [Spirochaetaceae bacterium 4572_7]|nr:MAG: hypothetical protein B6229_07785 [Spirochaetaceae bacterium 4572_7]
MLGEILLEVKQVFFRITVEGESYIYPLDIDRELEFYGSLGIVKVQIINKEVAIIDSTCRNHICVDAGFISKIGQSTACLPNRILVSIESSKMEDVDVGAY